MAKGDLKNVLINSRLIYDYADTRRQEIRSTFSETQLLSFAKQVADGMAHISAQQVSPHR